MVVLETLFLTTIYLWDDNGSESANFKERFGSCRRTTEQCIVPEYVLRLDLASG